MHRWIVMETSCSWIGWLLVASRGTFTAGPLLYALVLAAGGQQGRHTHCWPSLVSWSGWLVCAEPHVTSLFHLNQAGKEQARGAQQCR